MTCRLQCAKSMRRFRKKRIVSAPQTAFPVVLSLGLPLIQMSSSEVLAISLINEALDQGYPEKTLSALLLPAAGLEDVSLHVAPRYHLLLVAAKRKKAKVRLEKDGWVRL